MMRTSRWSPLGRSAGVALPPPERDRLFVVDFDGGAKGRADQRLLVNDPDKCAEVMATDPVTLRTRRLRRRVYSSVTT